MQYNQDEFFEILNIFKAESEEIIQSLNDGFLELEKNTTDKTPLKRLFQLSHSLKGAARMIGFNNVQNLAHKLEDVLSYWKIEENIIDISSFQTIYQVCDLLSELIEKSVVKQSDYADVRVDVFLEQLNSILVSKVEVQAEVEIEENKAASEVVISKYNTDINAIILELIFILEKENDVDFQEVFQVIGENLTSLKELFEKTQYSEITSKITSIIDKVLNSENHNLEVFRWCKSEIEVLRNQIYSICQEKNIKFSNNLEVEKPKITVDIDEKESLRHRNIAKFDDILKKLAIIKYEKTHIKEVIDSLNEIKECFENKKADLIISKTVNILNLFLSKDIVIDNDCYMVILQCIYLAKRMYLNEKEENLNNLNFLIQRLSVVEDLFKISKTEISKEVTKEKSNLLTSFEIDEFKKKMNSPEMQEIKTLRVDTKKVDNLISQSSELLVNGIRTREHLTELAKINSKLIKLNSESKKILNYLKYLEKKGFFNSGISDSFMSFYKKTQAFCSDNANMVGEIQNDFSTLYNIISEDDNKLHQTVVEIETIAKGIRVLPLATIFHSFSRMVRDIATEKNKKVDFIISGSDTTVDKKLIEEIKMPLIHLLRNAVSHGIEVPAERLKNGKHDTGVVRLSAKHVENNVLISIEDDGYGIDIERVKQTAIEKGLLTIDEINNSTNEQLMKLLFLPGFSTESSINEISGRGIGLDVVKTKINNLNGDIYIDSVLNEGCKVTIKLPLSMSTIKTFIINIDSQKYAIPIASIKFVKRVKKEEIIDRNGTNCIVFDGRSIPVYDILNVFTGKSFIEKEDKEYTVVILENQEKQAAYIVEELLGAQEVFHKKLMPPIIKIKNISGLTTLPTGEICLIINPYELIRNTISNNYLSHVEIKQLPNIKD